MTVLSVGSSVIDLFLKPNPQKLKHNQSDSTIQLKLGDKISTELIGSSIGGNAANVSFVLKKLNLHSNLYTYLGDDFFSKEIEELLKKNGILLHKESMSASTSFSVILSLEGDRIIFSHHDPFHHDFNYQGQKPDCIYLTSIGKEWSQAYEKILEYSQENQIQLAFSPGSHQMRELNDIVYKTINSSKYFFSNKEEAQKILLNRGVSADTRVEILEGVASLGPEVISITDGDNGSFAKDTKEMLEIDVPDTILVEKTGAGDAYAATFLACYTQTTNLNKSMLQATINANSVIKKVGAHNGLLTEEELSRKEQESQLVTKQL